MKASNVWLHSNGTPVEQVNSSTPAVNMSVVYAMEVDINNWKLVLQQFREIDSGMYTCRGASSSVSLDIRSGIYIYNTLAYAESEGSKLIDPKN